jgi:hypothetical protein
MGEWLSHPAVQAGVLPFLAALIVALPLRRSRWLAAAVAAGFAVGAAFAVGLSFESLTAGRKLVLAGFGGCVIALVWEARAPAATPRVSGALAFAAAACAVWVAWRVLAQGEAMHAVGVAIASMAFVAVVVAGSLRAARLPVRGLAVGAVLTFGAGALAVLGASALLAQLGIAAGSAAAAALLALWIAGRGAAHGWSAALPLAVIASLVALAAVLTASLAWQSLLPLAAAPWLAAWLPPRDARGPLIETAVGLGGTLLPLVLSLAAALP